MHKILVCITVQENSRRLIHKGYELANNLNGSLHILHIQKGQSVLSHPNDGNLLQELFSFGSQLGGEVYFLCSENILESIGTFVKDNHITHLVIGQPPTDLITPPTICNTLMDTITDVEFCVLDRNEAI